MKVYLDDERIAPEGWVQVRWPDETIKLLRTGTVTHLSLDHDLGDDQRGTGYDVLLWIEQEVALCQFTPPAMIEVHSANPAGRKRMLAAIESILRMLISTTTQNDANECDANGLSNVEITDIESKHKPANSR
jgi:hypothetical protein